VFGPFQYYFLVLGKARKIFDAWQVVQVDQQPVGLLSIAGIGIVHP
jgi:hypothetical protein